MDAHLHSMKQALQVVRDVAMHENETVLEMRTRLGEDIERIESCASVTFQLLLAAYKYQCEQQVQSIENFDKDDTLAIMQRDLRVFEPLQKLETLATVASRKRKRSDSGETLRREALRLNKEGTACSIIAGHLVMQSDIHCMDEELSYRAMIRQWAKERGLELNMHTSISSAVRRLYEM